MKTLTSFGQRMTRQVKNIEKLLRLYNAIGNKKHLDKALKLREKYINNANNPITITRGDDNTTTS